MVDTVPSCWVQLHWMEYAHSCGSWRVRGAAYKLWCNVAGSGPALGAAPVEIASL